MILSK
jgi:hypothetical protein